MADKETLAFRASFALRKQVEKFQQERGMSMADTLRELVRRGLADEAAERELGEIKSLLEAIHEEQQRIVVNQETLIEQLESNEADTRENGTAGFWKRLVSE